MNELDARLRPYCERALELHASSVVGVGVQAAAALYLCDGGLDYCGVDVWKFLALLAERAGSRSIGAKMPTILPPPEPQTMNYAVNAPLLAALMRQWGQRVSQALGDELYFSDRPAWARKYPDVAAGMGLPTVASAR
jgi:hypothetical protein